MYFFPTYQHCAWCLTRCRSGRHWGDVEFPLPFGRMLTPSEETVSKMDEATGASLKFTVLNPKGWQTCFQGHGLHVVV